jgi:hypothetical protein
MSNYTSIIDSSQETFKFVEDINKVQRTNNIDRYNSVSVLFNKGRYFEMSVYNKKIRSSIAQAIKCKVQHNTMIVGPKNKLEALVAAFNKRGIFVTINVDWI